MGLADAIDGTLFKVMHHFAQSPKNQPVIEAVDAFTSKRHGAIPAAKVRAVAMKAARDQFVKSGNKNPSADQVASQAYWGLALAAEEHPFKIAEDQRGTAKSIHYFMSGAIASGVASHIPLLPEGAKRWIGLSVSHAIGVLKEVADYVKGTGFDRRDIKTDDAGSKSAFGG